MHVRNIILFIALLAALAAFTANSYCQDSAKAPHASEITSEVPALDEFHSVIYKIWHVAWPEKDVNMLVELIPEIDSLSATIFSAQLPGILRDKKPAWDSNIEALKTAIANYKQAANPLDTQKLMGAAEQLHKRFEMLARSIRPMLKELDDFHTSLYSLYHYYLPNYDLKKIKTASKELSKKMLTLDKAKLPERLETKTAAFKEARQKLSASVKALAKTVKSNDKEKISADIETLHTNYQTLEKVFD